MTELPARGYRVDWLIQAEEHCRSAYVKQIHGGFAYIGAKDTGRGRLRRIRKHVQNYLNACKMFGLTKQNDYDLLQAKDNYFAAIVGLLVARLRRIPFFYWIAYPRPEASIYEAKAGMARYPLLYRLRGHFLKVLLYRVILPGANHVFVQSEQMKRDLASEGISIEKMTPIPSSVNLESIPYKNAKNTNSIYQKGKVRWIIYLGTLKRVRRLEIIIRSFAKVMSIKSDVNLIVMGKGDEEADLEFLKNEAKSLGISGSVHFTGHIDMSDAWEYVRQADVCLSPYYPTRILQSTSPTKLVEYMAMGKAVVANDHPEQSLVIEESQCGICVPWDENLFAQAIVEILDSPEMAAKMGDRGRKYIEQYRTNAVMGDLVEDRYRQVLQSAEIGSPGRH